MLLVVSVLFAAAPALVASSAPFVSNVLGSDMVLQRGAPADLWGWVAAGSAVTVTLGSQNFTSAPAGADGRWTVTLPAQPAGGPFDIGISSDARGGSLRASLLRVLFGDVFWCSGQSNLAGENTPVSYVFNATEELASADGYTAWVRVFQAGTFGSGASTPLPYLAYAPSIPWSPASHASVRTFSATCWFTGKGIADALGPSVPIGLVESAWGGTSIQVWEPPSIVASCGDLPSYPGGWPTVTSSLWNEQVVPFNGSRISGMVWYQGESNSLTPADQSTYYACALPYMVSSLRSMFRSPNAHCGVVQLAPWASTGAAQNNQVATLRQAQLRSGDLLAGISVITAVDGGDPYAPIGSIHPRSKQLVGRRLAAAALTNVYGRATPFAGPRYLRSAAVTPSPASTISVAVFFQTGGESLLLIEPQPTGPYMNSSVCPSGVTPALCAGFQVLGSDGVWRVASSAHIDATQNALILTASVPSSGPTITATGSSSGWSLWPITLLYSAASMLPVYPWNETIH